MQVIVLEEVEESSIAADRGRDNKQLPVVPVLFEDLLGPWETDREACVAVPGHGSVRLCAMCAKKDPKR